MLKEFTDGFYLITEQQFKSFSTKHSGKDLKETDDV